MKRNQGFTAVIPLLILGLGLVVAVLLVDRQTFFKPRASEPTPVTSPWGNALQFRSVKKSWVNIFHNYASPSAGLKLDGSFTVELWVKPESATQSATVACKVLYGWGASTKTPFCLKIDRSGENTLSAWWTIGTNNNVYTQPGAIINNNEWTNLAVTVDANTGTIKNFKNGKLGSTNGPMSKFTFDDPNEGITLGVALRVASSSGYIYESYFDGQIDELRISDGVRYTSDFQVSNVPFTRDSLTRGLWHFDSLETLPECGAFPVCYRDYSDNRNVADAIFVDSILSTVPYVSPDTHKACVNNACATVTGIGPDECGINSDCGPTVVWRECRNDACVVTDKKPLFPCNSNVDCKTQTKGPKADFTFSQKSVSSVGAQYAFVNKSSSPTNLQLLYRWEFGDGSVSTEKNPVHMYRVSRKKVYSVKLTATDSRGGSNSVIKQVTVTP